MAPCEFVTCSLARRLGTVALGEGWPNYSLGAKFRPPIAFVENKKLVPVTAHSFTPCLGLLLYDSRTEQLWQRPHGPRNRKYLLPGPSQEKRVDSCSGRRPYSTQSTLFPFTLAMSSYLHSLYSHHSEFLSLPQMGLQLHPGIPFPPISKSCILSDKSQVIPATQNLPYSLCSIRAFFPISYHLGFDWSHSHVITLQIVSRMWKFIIINRL